jgi:hypothetical protein
LWFYDYDLIPDQRKPVFREMVSLWRTALTNGTTRLPINLAYGAKFDEFEPALILINRTN